MEQPDQSQEPLGDKPPLVSPDTASPGGDEPPKFAPPGPASPPPARDLNQMENEIGTVNGNTIIANAYRELNNTYFINQQATSNFAIRHFSFNDIWRISAERQQEIAELFVADPVEVERLRALLEARRILVLTGESRSGKTTTAIHLSSRLTAVAENNAANSLDTYLVPSLDRHLKIDLHEFCKPDEINDRVVIFQNAFARGNLDLHSFFAQLNEFSLDQLAAKLRLNNSYLIFTATAPESAQLRPGQAINELQHELRDLSDELLVRGLERRLAHFQRAGTFAAERFEELEKPEQKEILIRQLRTMPRIVRFVEFFLRSESKAASRMDLGEAIRQFEDITYSFRQDPASDFDTWCFTLSLGLAQCLPDSQGVPWMDFEYLHRNVSRCLKRDPELFPSKGNSNEQASSEPSENKVNLTEDVYLAKCRAEVVKDPNSLGDLIRFCEDSYPRKLWEILLRHHRRVLTILLPRLREIAEHHGPETDSRQRELCARIIGRIGEIDPDRVTLSVMNRWIDSDDVRQRANIASLYEGILSSDAERYRTYLLGVLESLSASTTPNEDLSEDDRKEEKDRLLTCIAVYSKIGAYDLALAMTGLKRIARNKLAPFMEDVQRVGRLMESTKRAFAQQTSAQDALGLLIFHDMLRDLAGRVYNQESKTFVGAQYAFSSLCLTTDPIAVFKDLRAWIESSNQATGALVALMFLIQDGIASTLESIQVEVSTGGSGVEARKSCNPITAILTSGQEAVVEMARFLATIFEAFSVTFFLPKQLQDYLRESFLSHLTIWIEEALQIEICRQAMENLLIELMRIHNRRLSKPIDNLLNSRSFLKHEPDLKKAFVNAVLWPPR